MVDLLVTYLEMKVPPVGPALSTFKNGTRMEREVVDTAAYLDLYRAVGGPMQWDQRLRMPVSYLHRFLNDPATHLYILRLERRAVGLCEFDGVGNPDVELTNFGLIPEIQGQKLGPYLLDQALRVIWSQAPRRVWLHTDTDDHPKALPTYQRAGFQIYARRVETFPD
jgi:ribosomal protein S18 acetylase RimI-like enzyme